MTDTFAEYDTFTIKQIYDALAKNGFQHLRGKWTSQDINGVTVGACVLGQAALNLGVVDHSAYDEEDTLVAVLNQFDVDPDSKWFNYDQDGVGSTIVYWNDLEEIDQDDNPLGYTLKTYPEVVAMAYDLLSPIFDQTVSIATKEWSLPNGN